MTAQQKPFKPGDKVRVVKWKTILHRAKRYRFSDCRDYRGEKVFYGLGREYFEKLEGKELEVEYVSGPDPRYDSIKVKVDGAPDGYIYPQLAFIHLPSDKKGQAGEKKIRRYNGSR